ncbi:MAG: murein biosynthesis integral membrane protein MurJ [Acidimicrobiales bacterium]
MDGNLTDEDEIATAEPSVAVASDVTTGRLVQSSAVVAVGTAASRITGLVRVAVIGAVFGLGALADSYALANNTPNMVYELILGGVLSATLVPILVEQAGRDDPDGASAIVTVAAVVLVVISAIGVVAAPAIFQLYAWRLTPEEAAVQAELAVPFMRMFLPQMFFYGLTALATALLHARRRFFAPAFSPILNNVVVCAALLLAAAVAGETLTFALVRENVGLQLLIGLGTTAGIVAMTVPLVPAVRRAGWRLRWNLDWKHPAVIQVLRLSGWTVGYVAANQVGLAVLLALAYDQPGQVAAYTFAFVFFQLPHGLIAVSFMTTFVPEMADAAIRRDWPAYRDRLSLGIRLMATLILPASIGYVLLSRPLVSVLLQRGEFDAADARLTAGVLAGFAVGLLGFSVYLFALRGFYALRDTRTPFVLNLVANGLKVALAVALVGDHGAKGLALAYAVSYSVVAVVALVVLGRRVGGIHGRRLAASLARLTLAAAVMGVAVWVVTRTVGGPTGGEAVLQVTVAVVVGVAVYAAALLLLRADEIGGLRSRLRRR